jgi:hypothetical protein
MGLAVIGVSVIGVSVMGGAIIEGGNACPREVAALSLCGEILRAASMGDGEADHDKFER